MCNRYASPSSTFLTWPFHWKPGQGSVVAYTSAHACSLPLGYAGVVLNYKRAGPRRWFGVSPTLLTYAEHTPLRFSAMLETKATHLRPQRQKRGKRRQLLITLLCVPKMAKAVD